jgi:hypothetical protein
MTVYTHIDDAHNVATRALCFFGARRVVALTSMRVRTRVRLVRGPPRRARRGGRPPPCCRSMSQTRGLATGAQRRRTAA